MHRWNRGDGNKARLAAGRIEAAVAEQPRRALGTVGRYRPLDRLQGVIGGGV